MVVVMPMERILIEFVVDVPNPDVARDVETRLVSEHGDRLAETLKSITGFEPLAAPGRAGILIGHEPVTWSESEKDWLSEDDDEDDEDDDE